MGSRVRRRKLYPGATAYHDRHGVRRWRYRRGAFSAEVGREYGSEDFIRRYEAAVSGSRPGPTSGAVRNIPYSVRHLVSLWYRSPGFLDLAPSTQKLYRGIVERFCEHHGDKPVRMMQRRHVQSILAERAETPTAANNLRKRLIQLLDFAIAQDWRLGNLAKATKPYRISGEGFHTWDETEIAKFFSVHRAGTLPHLAVTLMLYTGAARSDVVRLGPDSLRNDRIRYRRLKTERSGGVVISLPIHPDLRQVIATLPNDRTYLATRDGRQRSPEGLGNLMRTWKTEAGIPHCASHGLRKACARRLAEAGATAHQISAVTGHKTLAQVQRYTEAVDREDLADAAIGGLIARPNGTQTLANLPARFAKPDDNMR